MPDKFNREKPQNTYKILHVTAKFWVELYKEKILAVNFGRNGCDG